MPPSSGFWAAIVATARFQRVPVVFGRNAAGDRPASGANGDLMSARPFVRLNMKPSLTPCVWIG